jgi:DNA-binding transcriptional LysR family regulator
MDLRRLRYFVAVAEERSVGRAAVRLRMAQPPLSVQIRKLESEVGTPLFRRGTRGMELTAAGRALLSRAREALALTAEGFEAARAVAAGRRGRLSVGYMFALAHAVLPRLVPELRRTLPKVDLEFIELSASTREARLLDHSVTVALCMPAILHSEIEVSTIGKQRMMLAMPAGSQLARAAAVPVRKLQGRPLISTRRSASSLPAKAWRSFPPAPSSDARPASCSGRSSTPTMPWTSRFVGGGIRSIRW